MIRCNPANRLYCINSAVTSAKAFRIYLCITDKIFCPFLSRALSFVRKRKRLLYRQRTSYLLFTIFIFVLIGLPFACCIFFYIWSHLIGSIFILPLICSIIFRLLPRPSIIHIPPASIVIYGIRAIPQTQAHIINSCILQ